MSLEFTKIAKFLQSLPDNTLDYASKGASQVKEAVDFISQTENQILIGSSMVGFILQPVATVLGAIVGYKGTEYLEKLVPDRFKKFGFQNDSTAFNGLQKAVHSLQGKPKYLIGAAVIASAYFGYLPIFAKGSFFLAASLGNHLFVNTTTV